MLTLYTKSRCHLCDEMKSIIYKLKNEFQFEYDEINIENDNQLFERYKEKIPVLMINGKLFTKYRLDENNLREKLKSVS